MDKYDTPAARPRKGRFLDAIQSVLGLRSETRAEIRALNRPDALFRGFYGIDHDAELRAAYDHYDRRLLAEGLDPANYEPQIEWAVRMAYNRAIRIGAFAPASRSVPPIPEPAGPRSGSHEAIRDEARRVHDICGKYGLPSFGGHVLTPEEERLYGVRRF